MTYKIKPGFLHWLICPSLSGTVPLFFPHQAYTACVSRVLEKLIPYACCHLRWCKDCSYDIHHSKVPFPHFYGQTALAVPWRSLSQLRVELSKCRAHYPDRIFPAQPSSYPPLSLLPTSLLLYNPGVLFILNPQYVVADDRLLFYPLSFLPFSQSVDRETN